MAAVWVRVSNIGDISEAHYTLEGAASAKRHDRPCGILAASFAAARSTVSELDRLKEQLGYLRFWLGIMVVTEITLVGWLISTPNTADPVLWSLAAVGVVLLGFGIFLLHRQIERRIEEVRRL